MVLRMKLAQTCDSKCLEEAGHKSRACFCACKMRKADRNQFLLNVMNVPDKKQLSGEGCIKPEKHTTFCVTSWHLLI